MTSNSAKENNHKEPDVPEPSSIGFKQHNPVPPHPNRNSLGRVCCGHCLRVVVDRETRTTETATIATKRRGNDCTLAVHASDTGSEGSILSALHSHRHAKRPRLVRRIFSDEQLQRPCHRAICLRLAYFEVEQNIASVERQVRREVGGDQLCRGLQRACPLMIFLLVCGIGLGGFMFLRLQSRA
jgi:hypothetical protein